MLLYKAMCMNCTKSRSRFQFFEIYIAYYLLLIKNLEKYFKIRKV